MNRSAEISPSLTAALSRPIPKTQSSTCNMGNEIIEDSSIQNFPSTNKDSTFLERNLRRSTYKTRYLFVGKPLLWMTCFFGSLGDALFGYDQGKTSFL